MYTRIGLRAVHLGRIQHRNLSLWSKVKQADQKVNEIGNSKETLRWLRIIGLSSTMVLLAALGYAGTYVTDEEAIKASKKV